MKPKFACADFAFPLLRHEDSLRLIAMMGFDGADIGLFQDRSHVQPSTEFANVKKSAGALKAKLADVGLAAADIFLQTALDFVSSASNHPEESVRTFSRAQFLRTIEYACEAGAVHISALPGVHFPTETRDASFERCCAELAWRVDNAARSGLVFGVEAHVGSIAETPEQALALVQAVPGLTLTLDYTHFCRQGIPDARSELLLPYASHFHARGAANGQLQTMVSESEIDYRRVVDQMKTTCYDGYIGIEYTWNDWENCNRVDNVSETILLKRLMETAWHESEVQ